MKRNENMNRARSNSLGIEINNVSDPSISLQLVDEQSEDINFIENQSKDLLLTVELDSSISLQLVGE